MYANLLGFKNRQKNSKIIGGHVNNPTWYGMQPRKRCKKAYGLVKMQKNGAFRPMVTLFDTPRSGIEICLKIHFAKTCLGRLLFCS